MKAWYGAAATKENDFALRLAAEDRRALRRAAGHGAPGPGQGERLLLPGLQSALVVPGQGQGRRRPAQAEVPRHHRPAGHRDRRVLAEPRRVQRRRPVPDPDRGLPAAVDLLRRGGRLARLQLAAGCSGTGRAPSRPAEAKGDLEIMGELFLASEEALRQGGGAFPDPILKLDLAVPHRRRRRRPDEVAREFNGQALADVPDPKNPGAFLVRQGEQVPGFAVLQDDGSTACGCWIFAGCWTAGRQPDGPPGHLGPERARAVRPAGRGPGRPTGASSTTAPPATPTACPATPPGSWCGGTGRSGSGNDVPDFKADSPARRRHEPVHHDQRGRGPALGAGHDRRAVPRALRALRDAARQEPASARCCHNPARAGLPGRLEGLRQARGVPLRGHHLPAHRALPLLDQARPHPRHPPAGGLRRARPRGSPGSGASATTTGWW